MTRTRRLEAGDFTYWFLHRELGWSVVLQLVWTFDRPPGREALSAINKNLASSPLNRLVAVSGLPGVRPRWVRADTHPGLIIDVTPIDSDLVGAWADAELESAPLDPLTGPPWQLRGVFTEQGGFALSLTALHLVTDGQNMVGAAVDAFTDRTPEPLWSGVSGVGPRRQLIDEGVDLLSDIGSAIGGVVRAAATGGASMFGKRGAIDRAPRLPMHERAPRAHASWSTVSVDSDVWTKVAAEHGGTSNSLFIAVISGVLRSSGCAPLGVPIKVGIPVSQRTDGDDRANATAGVSVTLTDEPVPGGTLRHIRQQCKAAFTALDAGRRPAMIHLQPLMWLLPAQLIIKTVSSGDGMPDAVASNLGVFTPELTEVGGVAASGVAFRGIAQGVNAALPYRFGDGVQSWLLEYGGTTTFSVAAFDEMHIADSAELGGILAEELRAWGVPFRLW